MNEPLQQIVKRLIAKLKAKGFKIQYYKSYSTNSYYLKLDYGVANTIRVSDHKGKGYLKYRFNIGSHIKEYEEQKTPQGWPMYFYRLDRLDNMIKKIMAQKQERLNHYGESGYQALMQKNLQTNQHNKGFWSQSKEL